MSVAVDGLLECPYCHDEVAVCEADGHLCWDMFLALGGGFEKH